MQDEIVLAYASGMDEETIMRTFDTSYHNQSFFLTETTMTNHLENSSIPLPQRMQVAALALALAEALITEQLALHDSAQPQSCVLRAAVLDCAAACAIDKRSAAFKTLTVATLQASVYIG